MLNVEGLGKFQNVTHVEVKNPVGSAIKIANGQKGSIAKQGKYVPSHEKNIVKEYCLKGAEDAGGSEGILFLNDNDG